MLSRVRSRLSRVLRRDPKRTEMPMDDREKALDSVQRRAIDTERELYRRRH
ncbi:hypothetical protein [Haloarchaeobius sp. TZWSO28]|uniref:hypothetical protein n=1 Tax=Haloarchaeobius sp. TZWSO28 TaxID=3446119 RepID=UPI003EB94D3C